MRALFFVFLTLGLFHSDALRGDYPSDNERLHTNDDYLYEAIENFEYENGVLEIITYRNVRIWYNGKNFAGHLYLKPGESFSALARGVYTKFVFNGPKDKYHLSITRTRYHSRLGEKINFRRQVHIGEVVDTVDFLAANYSYLSVSYIIYIELRPHTKKLGTKL